MEEIWKDVVGFEGLYKVSNYGNIYSCRAKRNLIPTISTTGYYRVALCKDNKKY